VVALEVLRAVLLAERTLVLAAAMGVKVDTAPHLLAAAVRLVILVMVVMGITLEQSLPDRAGVAVGAMGIVLAEALVFLVKDQMERRVLQALGEGKAALEGAMALVLGARMVVVVDLALTVV
jgi:hypothetical protein